MFAWTSSELVINAAVPIKALMLNMPVPFKKLRRDVSTVSTGGVGVHCPEQLAHGDEGAAGLVHSLGVIGVFS
jgi:hypothetical protein